MRVRPRDRRGERIGVADDSAAHAHGCAVERRSGCDRRSLGSEAHDVLARVHDAHGAAGAVGELARGDAHRRCDLPAERAAVGERRHRVAARLAPRCVGLQVRRFDPRRAEPHAVGRRCRRRERRYRIDRRPSALHLARERAASRSVSATTHDMPAASTAVAVDPGGSGTATRASRGAPSSAKPPSPNGTSGPTSCDAPPSSSARRAAAAASRALASA